MYKYKKWTTLIIKNLKMMIILSKRRLLSTSTQDLHLIKWALFQTRINLVSINLIRLIWVKINNRTLVILAIVISKYLITRLRAAKWLAILNCKRVKEISTSILIIMTALTKITKICFNNTEENKTVSR